MARGSDQLNTFRSAKLIARCPLWVRRRPMHAGATLTGAPPSRWANRRARTRNLNTDNRRGRQPAWVGPWTTSCADLSTMFSIRVRWRRMGLFVGRVFLGSIKEPRPYRLTMQRLPIGPQRVFVRSPPAYLRQRAASRLLASSHITCRRWSRMRSGIT